MTRGKDDPLVAAFRDVALTLGGIFTLYEIPDEAVWAITRGVEDVFLAHCAALRPGTEHANRAHPAVAQLIARIDTHVDDDNNTEK